AVILVGGARIALLAQGTAGRGAGSGAALALGTPAPHFTLADLDGGAIHLSAVRGRLVLVKFLATRFPPCRIEMPEIARVHEQLRDQDVAVIGIDLQEDAETVRASVARGKFAWTFAIDPDGAVARAYQITLMPSSVFIDRQGIVREVFVGALTRD